jgi:hypothetical protein
MRPETRDPQPATRNPQPSNPRPNKILSLLAGYTAGGIFIMKRFCFIAFLLVFSGTYVLAWTTGEHIPGFLWADVTPDGKELVEVRVDSIVVRDIASGVYKRGFYYPVDFHMGKRIGSPENLAFSADGSLCFLLMRNTKPARLTFHLIEYASGAIKSTVDFPEEYSRSMAISEDDSTIVLAGWRQVYFWSYGERATNDSVSAMLVKAQCYSPVVSRNGNAAVAKSLNESAIIRFDPKTGDSLKTYPIDFDPGPDSLDSELVLSPNGRYCAYQTDKRMIALELSTGRIVLNLKRSDENQDSRPFSDWLLSDNIFIGSKSHYSGAMTQNVYDLQNGDLTYTFKSDRGYIRLSANEDILTFSSGRTYGLGGYLTHDLLNRKYLTHMSPGHLVEVIDCRFSDDATLIASIDREGRTIFRDREGTRLFDTIGMDPFFISGDGKTIWTQNISYLYNGSKVPQFRF